MAGKAVEAFAQNSSGDLVVSNAGATVEQIKYAVKNGLRLYVEDTETATEEDFLLRQLDKDLTEDSIAGDSSLTKLEDLLGVVIKVTSYQGMRNSTFDGSKLGVFSIFEVTDRDGQVFTTSAGSSDIVIKMAQFQEAKAIPTKYWYVFEKSEKATAAGFYPINMKRVPDPEAF